MKCLACQILANSLYGRRHLCSDIICRRSVHRPAQLGQMTSQRLWHKLQVGDWSITRVFGYNRGRADFKRKYSQLCLTCPEGRSLGRISVYLIWSGIAHSRILIFYDVKVCYDVYVYYMKWFVYYCRNLAGFFYRIGVRHGLCCLSTKPCRSIFDSWSFINYYWRLNL